MHEDDDMEVDLIEQETASTAMAENNSPFVALRVGTLFKD